MTRVYRFKRDAIWLQSVPSCSYLNIHTTGSLQVQLVSGDGFSASLPLPLVLASSSILQSILSPNYCCGSVGISLPSVRGTTLVLAVDILLRGETSVLTGAQNSGEMLKEVQSIMDILECGVSVALRHQSVSSKLQNNNVVENRKILNGEIGNWNKGSPYIEPSPYSMQTQDSIEEIIRFENIDKTLPIEINTTNKNVELDLKIQAIIERSEGRKWKCTVCEKISQDKAAAGYHAEIHIEGSEQTCPQCGKTCSTRKALRIHVRKNHVKTIGDWNQSSPYRKPSPHGLQTQDSKEESINFENIEINGTTDKNIKLDLKIQEIIERSEGGKWKCKVCEKMWKDKYAAGYHAEIHIEGFEQTCPQCGKICPTRAALSTHKYDQHTERSFSCEVCQKFGFSKKGYYNHKKTAIHMKLANSASQIKAKIEITDNSSLQAYTSGETDTPENSSKSKFVCPKCEKIISSQRNLSRHIRLVHPETLTSCDICQLNFVSENILERHMLSKHSIKASDINIEAPNNVCPICGERFQLKESLNIHVKSEHGGYKNPEKFSTEFCLEKNLKVRYFCIKCDKKFVLRTNAEKHNKLLGHSVEGVTKFKSKNGK